MKFVIMLNLWIIAVFSFTVQAAENSVLIKAEKIYTVSQGIIENGMIWVVNGKIKQVGKDFPVPENIPLVSAKTVIPGLIDMHTHLGVYSTPNVKENEDGNEMTDPITPQVHALDSFNFDDPAIPVSLAGGVTTIVSRPGSGNVIGGTSVAVKLKNAAPEQMILKNICDLKMAIEGNPVAVYKEKKKIPSTLMGVFHLAEKAFTKALEYQEEWDEYLKKEKNKKGKEKQIPKRDLGKDVLLMAIRGEIPVHIHCATPSEMINCIRLSSMFNFKLSLGHVYWAYLIVNQLAEYKDVFYNVGPPMFFCFYQNALHFKNTAAILANAGLNVSLQTDAFSGAQQNLRQLAILCVRYGMNVEDALKAITLNGAQAVNLHQRIGSIAAGLDADLVLLNGDPMEMTTNVEKVFIDGKLEYENPAAVAPIETAIADQHSSLEISNIVGQAEKIAIIGKVAYTMAGEPIQKATLLVEQGKIKAIGQNIDIPSDYQIIQADNYVLMPGLVSARSFTGISSNWRNQAHLDEISDPIVPHMEAKYALEPFSPQFSMSRLLGITTSVITPGNANVMGGYGLAIKTKGSVVDKMIVKDRAVMVFSLGKSAKRENQMPSTRMGIAALLRKHLTEAQEFLDENKVKKNKKQKKKYIEDALLPVIEGRVPVMIHCERKDDILTALRLAEEYHLHIIIEGGTAAWQVADHLKRRNIPVIINQQFRGNGNIEDHQFNSKNAVMLDQAGVKIAFSHEEGSWLVPGTSQPGGDLLEIAAFAYRQGLPEQAALRAITLSPAEMYGISDRVGSLEVGKDADIIILGGHPLRTAGTVKAVFIQGKLVYCQQQDQFTQTDDLE